ncbi:hypothetical protein [Methanobrevibacter sp.]|uniref:MSCRAMM family protein n=1 Tax=Methanobrevibacter sp. TaxID=66852 RepID=UPI00386E60E9
MSMKKHLVILGFLFVLICMMSQVSAAEDFDNLTDTDFEETIDETAEVELSSKECGTFTDLDTLVYEQYVIELDRDYAFNPEKDDESLKSGIYIGHELVLNGNNHTIYANGARTFVALEIVRDVYIYNLNFENIYSPEFLETYDGNALYYGGALINTGSIYLENCTFINNFALVLGGAILNADYATLYLNNCKFINNSVLDTDEYFDDEDLVGGGAIAAYGRAMIINSTFENNFGNDGGAIATSCESYIYDCTFVNNRATTRGGAIYNHRYNASSVYNCSFKSNQAAYGGAVYDVSAIRCYFDSDNHADTKKGHNMYSGVNIDSISEKQTSEYFYDVINSESFSCEPLNLIFDNREDAKLELLVKSNPNGEVISAIDLYLRIEDEYGDYNYYLVRTNETGIASMPLSNLTNGTYKLTVFFAEDFYNNTQINYTLVLGKVQSKISFSAGIVFEYGRVGSVYVNVVGGTLELKNIKVVGHPEAKIDLNGKLVTISGLDVGSYTLRVISIPDENHSPGEGTISISVKKAVAVIKASQLTVALKKGTLWSIYLVDSRTNMPIANMQLALQVFTGKKYKIVKVTTNANGVATYKTSSLSKGTHKIIVSGTHSGYSFNTLTSSIKVIKPKQLTFKVQKRVNDKNGALISYVVKDKKTNKGINGVKINLLIYTGKKYKVISLKTKKSGKYNGAMGFSTNDLSVGKHKVIIVPANIKYSGSAKTTMIIKKAAKKKQTYSHIL